MFSATTLTFSYIYCTGSQRCLVKVAAAIRTAVWGAWPRPRWPSEATHQNTKCSVQCKRSAYVLCINKSSIRGLYCSPLLAAGFSWIYMVCSWCTNSTVQWSILGAGGNKFSYGSKMLSTDKHASCHKNSNLISILSYLGMCFD